jgi:hypothetical protein
VPRLICVARVDGPFALALVQSKLGGAGIWSSVDIFHMANNHSHCAIAFGGAKVEVLEADAEEAVDVLADGPALTSSGLRGWRMLLMIFVLFQTAAGPSPFAVYLQRPVLAPRSEQTA